MSTPQYFQRPATFVLLVPLLLLGLLSASCTDDNDDGTTPPVPTLDATGTIGPAGGTIASSDGRLTLIVPANALAAETDIVITEVTAADVAATAEGLDVIYALTMEPAGVVFAEPVILELVHETGGEKRPSTLQEHKLSVSILSAVDLQRSIPAQDIILKRLAGVSVVNRTTLTRGFDQLAYGVPAYYLDGVAIREATVAAGVDIPPPQVVQDRIFRAEAALKLSSVLDLESDIAFSAETTEGYHTVVGDGFAFKYEPFGGEDGSNEYHFDPQYTATTWGDAFLNLAVTYRVGLLMEVIWVDELTRPVRLGDISIKHQFESYAFNIAEGSNSGNELAPGTYALSIGLEGGFVLRGLFPFPYNNTIAVSGSNATTLVSLSEELSGAIAYTGLQFPGQQDWGTFPISYAQKDIDENTLAFCMFGPSGARLTSWLPEDQEFGWTQLLMFTTAVTDGQPFAGNPTSGGFVYVANGFNQVHLIEFNPETGFYDTSQSINYFPEAPGNAFTAAARPGGGAVVVTDGSPGKIYYHDLVDVLQPAVMVGDAGNMPRRIRTAGNLAFISNFESDNLTILTWSPEGVVAVVGQVGVGDGPVGIDGLVLPGGNVAVASTGFNDHTSTVTVLSPSGSVVSNVTSDLPAGATNPGHAFWLRGEAAHFAVTCNTSGHLVVVDSGLD